jgi:hypothetical protein
VGTAFDQLARPLFLTTSGPGFCLHHTVQRFDKRTAALLERIEHVGTTAGDVLIGGDVVHFDYHLGNVMVDDDRPGVITAVVDWMGARPGSVELDLALLAFDLSLHWPGPLEERVERVLVERANPELLAKVWAHAGLRMLDWSIRHHPHDVNHWISMTARHLPR